MDKGTGEVTNFVTKILRTYRTSKSLNPFRRVVAALLIYSQIFQIALAAAPSTVPQRSFAYSNSSTSPVNYSPTGAWNNFSLTNQQLGLKGPLSWRATYSDLTGTFFNAQYVLPMGEKFALGALGEYGANQYRLNGTLGYGFSPTAQIKATIERLGQRLPFQFDSGSLKSLVTQDAYGLRFQQLFDFPLLQGINAGGYWAQADNKNLAPIIFTSNGSNCNGFAAGLQCINYRNIAGGTSTGFDAGIDLQLTSSTFVSGNLYYDQVRYHTVFTHSSNQDRDGLGAGIKINQLLNERVKLVGEATAREIYDTYQAGVSWLPNTRAWGMELSLLGQHLVSHNATPDNNSISLQLSLLPSSSKHYDEKERPANRRLSDLAQWVQTPAVKMEQVLAIAEQVTKLLAPSINSISPNIGPIEGGNTITIIGSNFVPGLLVYIDGQLATNIQVLSPTTIKVTVPASTGGALQVVDVVVQNVDGQQALLADSYTYTADTPPSITSLSPTQGSTAGNTTVTIFGSNLGATNSVSFGGVIAIINNVSNNQVTVTTPAHTAGLVSVVLTTTAGSINKNNAYTYVPTAPVITAITKSDGTVIAPNTTTNVQKPTIKGDAEAGTVVTIYNNDTELDTVNTDSNGHWVYTPTTPLADGSYSFTATATTGGVTSAASNSYAIAIDATAPNIPILTEVIDNIAPTTGPIADNGVTNDPRPTFNGTADPGVTVLIYDNGSQIGTPSAPSGTWTFTPSSDLGEGPHIITLKAQDAIGNTSGSSTAFNFTVDTTLPNTPQLTEVLDTVGPIQVPINDGDTTDDTKPTFNGTADPDVTVLIYDNGTPIGTAPVSSGSWTFIPTSPLAQGSHSITLVAQDTAGNTSPPSDAFNFNVDTAAPNIPVLLLVTDNIGPIVGPISPGGSTDDNRPTFEGTADSGVTVLIYDGNTQIGSASAPSGAWTFTPSVDLGEGPHTITLKARNAAGNTSGSSAAFNFTVDTIAPASPTVTSATTTTISGTTEAGATIIIKNTSDNEIARTNASPLGDWSVTLAIPLISGELISVTATDAAGNVSVPTQVIVG